MLLCSNCDFITNEEDEIADYSFLGFLLIVTFFSVISSIKKYIEERIKGFLDIIMLDLYDVVSTTL